MLKFDVDADRPISVEIVSIEILVNNVHFFNCQPVRVTEREGERAYQRMSMRDLEVLSSIDPITATITGDSE